MSTVGLQTWGKGVDTDDRPLATTHGDADTVDAELLAAARRDPAAFAMLYHRYVRPVYAYCRRRLEEEEAEDATSHIFLQALGHLDSCRGPSFRAWLFTIAHNVVIDRQRARKPTVALDDSYEIASVERSPEEHALESDRKRRLDSAIRQLPPDQRAAVELRLAGLSGVECAQALGKSPDATRMLQHRAFTTLRSALSDLSPERRR
jgi:RNA polymerase sigma-70 factor (ECF subfamily)